MPVHTTRLESRLLATAAMGLALAVTAPYRDAEAADVCIGGGLTTITAAQANADNCALAVGESVDVQASGSFPFTGADDAIFVSAGAAAGSITNAGSVSSADQAVELRTGSSLTGGITNSGTLTSTTASGDGILILSGSVAGAIDNSGLIDSARDGVRIFGAGGDVTGGITNSATIDADADGLHIFNSASVSSGGITNASGGTITGGQFGILVSDGTVTGNITNAGTLTGTASDGINIQGAAATVAGSITNTDTLNAGGDGIVVDDSASITAGISNSGTISAGASGIFIDNASSIDAAGITNTSTGDITAVGFGIIISSTATVTGGISNAGDITSTGNDGIGLNGGGTTVAGGITNASGATIDGADDGIALENSASVTSGGISNSGTITTTTQDGIRIADSSSVTGDVLNAAGGTIAAARVGIVVDGTGTLTGSITNSGTITAGANGFGLGASSTVTGDLTNDGTINAANGMLLQAGATVGTITNTGTIDVTGDGFTLATATVADLTNSGTIDADDVGMDLDAVTASGSITNSGTIAGATAALRITNPVTQLTIDNAGTLDGNVVLSNAALDLTDDAARVIGNVTGSASSAVSVEADFTSEGIFNVGTFSVGGGNRLDLANTVTATTFANSGTVAIGENAVTLTTNYTQVSGAGLEIGATSDSSFGQLTVSGTVDLSASDALHVVVGNGASLAAGDELLDVVQAGTLTASGVTVTDSSALLEFEGVVDGNTIDLTTARARSIEDIVDAGGSGNGGGAAGTLDSVIADGPSGDMQTIVDALNSLGTDQAVESAVQQMLPSITGGHAQGNVVAAQAGATNVVQDRLIRLSGLNAGDGLFADPAAWIKPFAADTAQGARGGVSGYDGLTIGAAVGIDGRFTEDFRAGLALSYADSGIQGRGASDSSIDLDTIQVTAYGTYDIDRKTHVNVLGAFGWNENESRRAIDFGGLDRTAEADYDSWHGIADVELVRSYKLRQDLGFMPSLAVTYTYAHAEDYSETGAGAANLDVDDADADSLTLAAAGGLTYGVMDGVNLTGNLGLSYDVLAGDDQVTATFEGGGGAFVTESIDPAPFGVTGGVGLELLPDTGIDASLNYDIEAREDFRNHKVQLNLRIPF